MQALQNIHIEIRIFIVFPLPLVFVLFLLFYWVIVRAVYIRLDGVIIYIYCFIGIIGMGFELILYLNLFILRSFTLLILIRTCNFYFCNLFIFVPAWDYFRRINVKYIYQSINQSLSLSLSLSLSCKISPKIRLRLFKW